jgi:hypothetical protein
LPIEHLDNDALNNNIENLLKLGSAGIWAVTRSNAFYICDNLSVLKRYNVRFINENWKDTISKLPKSSTMVNPLSELEVFSSEIIREENIQTIIVPNGGDASEDIISVATARYSCVLRIVHITELLEGVY